MAKYSFATGIRDEARTVRLAPTACGSCLHALTEEGYDEGRVRNVGLLVEIGADIPAHTCEATDGRVERCNCGCRP